MNNFFLLFPTYYVISGLLNGSTNSTRCLTFKVSGARFMELMDNRQNRGLGDGWVDIMYQGFHGVWPFCAISMKRNYLQRPCSKKIQQFNWNAFGKCRTGNCISVKFTVDEIPRRDIDVTVVAEISGECSHKGDNRNIDMQLPNRRYLSGKKRAETVDKLKSTGLTPNELNKRYLSEMSVDECISGNTTKCQSPGILKQALSESNRSKRLHENVTYELDIQRRAWLASLPGTNVQGYIQSIGLYPFHVLFYLEGQVKAYIASAKTADCTLHVDATGSIISSLGEKSGRDTVYLYSVVLAKANLPVCEFLSADHRSHSIQGHLDTFNACVASVNHNKRLRPNYVVTDFSYALIHAVTKSFNECDLVAYLNNCEKILSKQATSNMIASTCFIILCKSHMIKALSKRVTKLQSDNRQRQAFLVWFCALQTSASLSEAVQIYRDMHLVLCTKCDSQVVSDGKQRLHALATGITLPNVDVEEGLVDNDSDVRDVESTCSSECGLSLKERSPFTRIFQSAISSVVQDEDETVSNALYSPKTFIILQDIVHLFPLWSAILQTQPNILASDCNTSIDNCSSEPRCLTNGVVESHFKSIKHGRLGYSTRVRPRVFLECELTYVIGKLNEKLLPATVKRPKKVTEGSDLTTEKWSKRKRGKYSSKGQAAKILQSLPSKVKQKEKVSSPDSNHNRKHTAVRPQNVPSRSSTPYEDLTLESKDTERHEQPPSNVSARNSCEEICPEYDDMDIERHLTILRNHFPSIHGLQSTLLGQYIPGSSIPHFKHIAVNEKFVQVLHNYDHWVCVTNVFSENSKDVYVYDSLYSTVAHETVVQTSSLLRLHDDGDFINFHIRNYQNQTSGSRLCGLYAVAAATAACYGIDLSSHVVDEELLVHILSTSSKQQMPLLVPCMKTGQKSNVNISKKMMLYCFCQGNKHKDKMIKCSNCLNWFHQSCVGLRGNDLPNLIQQWQCKFCCVQESATIDGIAIDDDSKFVNDAEVENVKVFISFNIVYNL